MNKKYLMKFKGANIVNRNLVQLEELHPRETNMLKSCRPSLFVSTLDRVYCVDLVLQIEHHFMMFVNMLSVIYNSSY
jgi:hypothetical protein